MCGQAYVPPFSLTDRLEFKETVAPHFPQQPAVCTATNFYFRYSLTVGNDVSSSSSSSQRNDVSTAPISIKIAEYKVKTTKLYYLKQM